MNESLLILLFFKFYLKHESGFIEHSSELTSSGRADQPGLTTHSTDESRKDGEFEGPLVGAYFEHFFHSKCSRADQEDVFLSPETLLKRGCNIQY